MRRLHGVLLLCGAALVACGQNEPAGVATAPTNLATSTPTMAPAPPSATAAETTTETASPKPSPTPTETTEAETTEAAALPDKCEPRDDPQDQPYASHAAKADVQDDISVFSVQAVSPHSTHPDREDVDLVIYVCSSERLPNHRLLSAANEIALSLYEQEGWRAINQLYVSSWYVEGGELTMGPKTKVEDYQGKFWDRPGHAIYYWEEAWK